MISGSLGQISVGSNTLIPLSLYPSDPWELARIVQFGPFVQTPRLTSVTPRRYLA